LPYKSGSQVAVRKSLITAVAAGLLLAALGHPPVAVAGRPASSALAVSVGRAYTFLNRMLDRYARGATPRLVQSFTGGALARQHYTASVTYDDAVMIDAYLARRTAAALASARVIGNGLLYVQAHDPRHDGRVRAAYDPRPLTRPSAVRAVDRSSDVGNMAWAGMALAQLYAATRDRAYLRGAVAIGAWIQAHCHDTRGAGGYTGGLTASGARIRWKSTEHNIDAYALFRMLATETGQRKWTTRAAWARRFVASMWDRRQHRFYVGTTDNGAAVNNSERPEDVNSWSYLALRDRAYATSVSWDVTNLAVHAHGFSGVSFCRGDRSGVWFEGTAHLADALELRGRHGDAAQARTYLADIEHAQYHGSGNDGHGIIAASKNRLSDCDGDFYYASLHTGATAWYILAALKINPFVLIRPGRL
jgi:hypothetical protein